MGYDLTNEYRKFIQPTKAELAYEEWFESLSDTEKELVLAKDAYDSGKRTWGKYIEDIHCILYQNQRLSDEECDRLWDKYGNALDNYNF